MRLKLDENLGVRTAEFLRSAGHDVTTVPSQKLYSSSDRNLLETCSVEKRCLVTLDLEFGNPFCLNLLITKESQSFAFHLNQRQMIFKEQYVP